MQQLFGLINDVFEEDPKSRQANLSLRTFQVVPLSPCAGLMQWVDNTVTLGKLLTGDGPAYVDGAHTKYRRQDWNHSACRKRMDEGRHAESAGERGAGC